MLKQRDDDIPTPVRQVADEDTSPPAPGVVPAPVPPPEVAVGIAGKAGSAAGADTAEMVVFDPEEANALIRYVASQGLADALAPAEDLALAVADLEAPADDRRAAKTADAIKLYGQLAALTYPSCGVNGRTALDSENVNNQRRRLLGVLRVRPHAGKALTWLIVAFTLAVLTEAMRAYYGGGRLAGTTGGWIEQGLELAWVRDVYQLVLLYLLPFFWGAVGASVYLVKHVGDLVAARKFEWQSSQGVSTRVLLGGVFGAVIVHLFSPTQERTTESAESTTAAGSAVADFDIIGLPMLAVAFLAGLGIRAIYAGFEKLIDVVADWIGKLGKRKPAGDATGNPA